MLTGARAWLQAYYAHLVAERGRILLDRDNINEDFDPRATGTPSVSSGGDGASSRGAVRLHEPHAGIKDRMFFC